MEKQLEKAEQAYNLLRVGLALITIIAGVDKFFNSLTDWSQYIAPQMIIYNITMTLFLTGVGEIIIGLGVWFKPSVFSYFLIAMLLSIIANLLLIGHFFDIMLVDCGLICAALALSRLSK